MEAMFGRCSRLLRNWMMLSREEEAAKLERWALILEVKSESASRLGWAVSDSPGSELDTGELDHPVSSIQCVIGSNL
jgi:hypothetical protein